MAAGGALDYAHLPSPAAYRTRLFSPWLPGSQIHSVCWFMWCSSCQQDVPALGAASSGQLHCGKCGNVLASRQASGSAASGAAKSPASPFHASPADNRELEKRLAAAAWADDDWTLEAELRGVQRLLSTLQPHSGAATALPHEQPPHWPPSPSTTTTPDARPANIQPPRGHAIAWTILGLGLAVFACGAVLLGWSLVARRADLWPLGMPLALLGQAGLVLGLVLQLDGLWHSSRSTAAALNELDGELKNVRQATTLLSSTHSAAGQSFYLHLAEGASPQLLLADLKGQMDLLAQQMARQHKG
jgi:hypothetical protein